MIYYKAVWAFLPFGFERKNGMIVLGIDPATPLSATAWWK